MRRDWHVVVPWSWPSVTVLLVCHTTQKPTQILACLGLPKSDVVLHRTGQWFQDILTNNFSTLNFCNHDFFNPEVQTLNPDFSTQEFMEEKFMVKKFIVLYFIEEECMVEEFMVEEFMIEQFMIEQSSWLKSLELKCLVTLTILAWFSCASSFKAAYSA